MVLTTVIYSPIKGTCHLSTPLLPTTSTGARSIHVTNHRYMCLSKEHATFPSLPTLYREKPAISMLPTIPDKVHSLPMMLPSIRTCYDAHRSLRHGCGRGCVLISIFQTNAHILASIRKHALFLWSQYHSADVSRRYSAHAYCIHAEQRWSRVCILPDRSVALYPFI